MHRRGAGEHQGVSKGTGELGNIGEGPEMNARGILGSIKITEGWERGILKQASRKSGML